MRKAGVSVTLSAVLPEPFFPVIFRDQSKLLQPGSLQVLPASWVIVVQLVCSDEVHYRLKPGWEKFFEQL